MALPLILGEQVANFFSSSVTVVRLRIIMVTYVFTQRSSFWVPHLPNDLTPQSILLKVIKDCSHQIWLAYITKKLLKILQRKIREYLYYMCSSSLLTSSPGSLLRMKMNTQGSHFSCIHLRWEEGPEDKV